MFLSKSNILNAIINPVLIKSNFIKDNDEIINKKIITFKNQFLQFLLIYMTVSLSILVDQFLNKKIELVIRSEKGISNLIWFWGLGSLISSLLFPLLISMLCCYALSDFFPSMKKMFSQKLELCLIETLRSWGKTFLWCFLFIIPGFIKYSFYILTPFIVLFSEKYDQGQVDALEQSEKLSKKFFWRLNFWILIFFILLPLLFSSLFDEYRLFSTHPLSACLIACLDSLLVYTFHYLILKLLNKYLPEVENHNNKILI